MGKLAVISPHAYLLANLDLEILTNRDGAVWLKSWLNTVLLHLSCDLVQATSLRKNAALLLGLQRCCFPYTSHKKQPHAWIVFTTRTCAMKTHNKLQNINTCKFIYKNVGCIYLKLFRWKWLPALGMPRGFDAWWQFFLCNKVTDTQVRMVFKSSKVCKSKMIHKGSTELTEILAQLWWCLWTLNFSA
jgi:hypothetical protein